MIRHTKEAGQVLPLVAICLAALMGFAGISVDVGYAEYQQRQQQSAADAAALGGAQVLVSRCGNVAAAQAAAIADAAKNGFTSGTNGVTVSALLGSQLTSGPFAGNTCAVQVQVTSPHPTWFGALFGFKGNVTTQAVALTPTTDGPDGTPPGGGGTQPCIQTMSTTATSTFDSASITCPPGGPINTTGPTTYSGGTITSPGGVGYSGTPPTTSKTNFPDSPPKPMAPPANPCPEIGSCAYLSSNPPSTSGCVSKNIPADSTLEPGCYTSITVTQGCMANVTLAPGLYVFDGTVDFTGAQSISGSGVTMYQAGGSLNLSDNPTVSLSPPTSGNYSEILYFEPASVTTAPYFGSASTLSGLIYAPGATNVKLGGTFGAPGMVLAGSVDITSKVTFQTGTGNTPLILGQAVLAQ